MVGGPWNWPEASHPFTRILNPNPKSSSPNQVDIWLEEVLFKSITFTCVLFNFSVRKKQPERKRVVIIRLHDSKSS